MVKERDCGDFLKMKIFRVKSTEGFVNTVTIKADVLEEWEPFFWHKNYTVNFWIKIFSA